MDSEVVEGKVDECRGGQEEVNLHQAGDLGEVGLGAGEEEKERWVSMEIIEDANILIEESEEEGFKSEDSENIDQLWKGAFNNPNTPVIQCLCLK